ncbi:hypothetical protein D3C76_346640 [compost metagenome]
MAIPGIPNLLRNAPKAIGITLLGNIASNLWNFLFPGPTWGVFNVGTTTPAIEVSSVVTQDLSAESQVSDYIIQSGSFTSYNKVRLPNIVAITLTKDGNEISRQEMLQWLDINYAATTVFDILSPEFRYPNMTLVAYRLSRSARSGAAMIYADCLFQEVRERPVAFSSTTIADPGNQPTSPTVRVYPAPPDKPLDVGGPIAWQ